MRNAVKKASNLELLMLVVDYFVKGVIGKLVHIFRQWHDV